MFAGHVAESDECLDCPENLSQINLIARLSEEMLSHLGHAPFL